MSEKQKTDYYNKYNKAILDLGDAIQKNRKLEDRLWEEIRKVNDASQVILDLQEERDRIQTQITDIDLMQRREINTLLINETKIIGAVRKATDTIDAMLDDDELAVPSEVGDRLVNWTLPR